MRTETEIGELLDSGLPDGPDNDYEWGAQDMALWILGTGVKPDLGI